MQVDFTFLQDFLSVTVPDTFSLPHKQEVRCEGSLGVVHGSGIGGAAACSRGCTVTWLTLSAKADWFCVMLHTLVTTNCATILGKAAQS